MIDGLAVWIFDWMIGLKGTLDPTLISTHTHPRVFAWVSRFRNALSAARSAAPEPPPTLTGRQVLEQLHMMSSTPFAEPEGDVDASDPLGLQRGEEVLVYPTDTGVRHRDRGRLVTLNAEEVVLQRATADGRFEVRIHFPRTNFRVVKV